MKYPVRLDWTDCTLGGRRAWFICPANGCGQRVAILYGGSVFACRHCHRLTYQTTREKAHNQAAERANKIRARLGWVPGVFNGDGSKPKGMHWRTFWALKHRYAGTYTDFLVGMRADLSRYENFLVSANALADKLEKERDDP